MQRPAAVSFFGFLNIVFSVFAIFGAFGSFGDLALQAAPGQVKNPIVALMNSNPAYTTWVKWTIPMEFLYCALLLIAGIGLLRLGEWGRKLAIATGIYAILMNLGVAAANFYFFHPPSTSSSHTNGSPAVDLIVAMMGAIFGLIYPVVLIVYMRRPEIIAAFRPPTDPSTPST